jgi:hypothetical protein
VATEKEKMLAGELYKPWDPELMEERVQARRLSRLINETTETEGDRRVELLKELFGSTGDKVYLEPNFPNPYRSTTSIHYTLEDASPVTIRVYSLTGRMVRELVNGLQPAGNHRVEFNGDGLASGIYYYVLTCGKARLARPMLLIR